VGSRRAELRMSPKRSIIMKCELLFIVLGC
jgi:hypothetical protein